jgi:membrane protease YdiL (CAAX protease family)
MFRLTPWRQYIGWVSAAAIAQFAVMFATVRLHEQLAEWRLLPKLPGTPDIIPSHFLGHALGLVATFVAVVILTPLVEEFACRGKMQYRLEHALGVVPAIAIPAVIFSLLHGLTIAIHQLPFALFVGWLVWRTASIWPAVYVHALNNTAVLVLIYLRGESAPYEPPSPWLWPSAIVIGLLGLGGLLTAASRINRLAQRSARNVASSGHGPANNQLSPVARG